MKELETTLLFLRKENKILLARKKKGFGFGKWNGIGGKLEQGETPEQAMIRETEEEIFVTPTEYEKVGIINFIEYYKDELATINMHVYVATKWDKTPKESIEMLPEWFEIDNLPWNDMLPDDSFWLPFVLEEKKIKAHFEFDKAWNLIKKKVEIVEEIDEIS